MHIFWRLILAHLLTDFTFQTDFIAGWKRKDIAGGAVHSLMFLFWGYALCFADLGSAWIHIGALSVNGWLSVLILTLLHFLEDESRVWTIKRVSSSDNIYFFLWDQFIHLILVFVFTPFNYNFMAEKWIFLAILFVLATHFATILIYYLEKDIFGHAEIITEEKYYSMVERLVTALVLLLPGYYAFSFLAIWLVRVFVRKMWQRHEFSWVNVVTGNILAVVIGLLGRYVYYS